MSIQEQAREIVLKSGQGGKRAAINFINRQIKFLSHDSFFGDKIVPIQEYKALLAEVGKI